MLVDLHAHFPMHLLVDEQQRTHERARVWMRQRWQGRVVELISRVANYQGPGDSPSVTEQQMRAGDVGVALSMLYQPFNEIDLTESYGAPPRASYFSDLVDQRQTVEDYVHDHASEIAIAHSVSELDSLLGRGIPILIHAIEGGFQLGRDPAEVRRNVQELAGLGVAYVTVAHLFFRDVATNAPALPFLPDWLYNLAFPQGGKGEGLTSLGHAVIDAMVDEGILIDLTHMRSQSITDVLAQLDARDPGREIPVLATHMAYRFGGLQYSFDDETIKAVAARGGVLGCILCEHFITSGLSVASSREGSLEALCRHIDKIRELTGSFDHIGIGSDLDGYIKPALPGLEDMSRMKELQAHLRARYGDADAEKISGGNALRVLRAEWGRKRVRP
jgi:microsomal dipeptidase-like Zn-dependent dipeptidase